MRLKILAVETMILAGCLSVHQVHGQGNVATDRLGRLHSAEVAAWQKEYNTRIHRSFRSMLGGLIAPSGIEMVSPQPPGRRGIEGALFLIPSRIRENGVLTRDTVSIPFFELGVQWNSLARQLAIDCEYASRSEPTIDCRRFQIDWRNQPSDRPAASDNDRRLWARYVGLQAGLAALRHLQSQLSRVVTTTVLGESADGTRDRQLYDARRRQCMAVSFMESCDCDASDFKFPLDWLTAQVDAALFSAVQRDIHEAEREVQILIVQSQEARDLFATNHRAR